MNSDVVLSWPAWAREQRKLGASARACLREIAVLADDRGAAIVEIAWLAQAVDRSERTVWRGLAALEERGLIVREERREEGHRAASRFQLVRDPARAINKARSRVAQLGVDVDAVASCAIDLNDNEGLRTALAQACGEGWSGPSVNRLALTLLEHGPRQFGRIAARQARYEAMSVSTALADVLTLAWIELRTSASSMIKARSPWAVWSRAVECAVANESLASAEDRAAITLEGILPEDGSVPSSDGGELYVGIDELTGPLERFIRALREAGMPATLAWAGSVRIAHIAAHGSQANTHTAAARDATLQSLGIGPQAARAWMTLLVGSRRGTVASALRADENALATQARVVMQAWRSTTLVA